MPLSSLLIPRSKDPGSKHIRPIGTVAAAHVDKAANIARQEGITEDWVSAEHCSVTLMRNPRPALISPATTSAKKARYWIG